MKNRHLTILISIAISASFADAQAQWTSSGTFIYNNSPASATVGINTSTPGAVLDLKTPGSSMPHLSFTTHRTYSSSRNWSMAINSLTEGDFVILESTSYGTAPSVARMVINVNGNVGIGAETPEAKLHISSGTNDGLRIGKIGDGGNTAVAVGAQTAQLNLDFTGYRDTQPNQIGARISALRFNAYANNSAAMQSTGLAFYTNPYGYNAGAADLAERLRIMPDGNVGIGTTSPSYKLTVAGGEVKAFSYDNNSGIAIGAEQTERPRIGFHVSDNNRRFKIEFNGVNTSTERLGVFTNNGGAWGGEEREVFSISKVGNVGIGTTSPNATLQIGGGTGALHGPYQGVLLKPGTGFDRAIMELHSPDGQNRLVLQSLSGASYLASLDGKPLLLGGNVGIGSMSPTAPLHVKATGAGTHMLIETNSAGEGDLWWCQGGTGPGSERAAFQINGSSGNFEGHVYGSSWQQWLAVNRNNGNVGIGTTTPGSYKLAVEGKIGAREVNVTTTAWSDYVFNDTYRLPPLSEVRAYINQHHHLPDVPSEKEVLQNGQNLGEMNAVLLKKVEELMLYVMELEEKVNKLEVRSKK